MTDVDWPAYLSAFHADRVGITEDVLEHALDTAGSTAYDWAAEPLAAETVLDLACGSAPMAARVSGARYLGLDLSPAELAAAAARGVPVARADVTRLPVPDGSVDAVVMSMALMLVPLPQTLNEVRRVLRPGGMFVATMPHNRPMPRADRLRYARLCLALRHPGLTYPNDRELADPQPRSWQQGCTCSTTSAGRSCTTSLTATSQTSCSPRCTCPTCPPSVCARASAPSTAGSAPRSPPRSAD